MLPIVLRHFRFLLVINLMWSLVLLANTFAGDPLTAAIPLIVVGKTVGYGFSILIEKWFYAKRREYYFKNAGIAYRSLFACLFMVDTALLILIASLWLTVRNFT